jgi:hypothetical protein
MDEAAYVLLPEGVLILAQDKRSAVLGEHQNTNRGPVGTVRNRYPERASTQPAICNPHGKLKKTDGRRLAFVVSHPSSKKRSMNGAPSFIPHGLAKAGGRLLQGLLAFERLRSL